MPLSTATVGSPKVSTVLRPVSWIFSGPNNQEPTGQNIRNHCDNNKASFFGRRTLLEYLGIAGFILSTILWFRSKLSAFLGTLGSIAAVVTGVLKDPIDELHSRLIFQPSKECYGSPAQEGIPHEEVFINTEDNEKLHGYFLPAKVKAGVKPTSINKTMIYLHGNADNVSSWYKSAAEIQNHVDVNMLVADYRGYGKSSGKPSREGVITDVLAIYDFLIDRGHKAEDILIYGVSIGCPIGAELAKRRKVSGLVMQAPPESIRAIAKNLFPFIPGFIIRNHPLNTLELIKELDIPLLIGHGGKDEIAPLSHGKNIFKAAPGPKKLRIFPHAHHNDISEHFDEEFYDALREIVKGR